MRTWFGFCPECGATVAGAVELPDERAALGATVGEWALKGLNVFYDDEQPVRLEAHSPCCPWRPLEPKA